MLHARSSSPAVGFGLLLTMLVLVAAGKPVVSDGVDPDMFWHLRVGEQLLQQGVGPIVDRFSYNASDRAWTPYSWLAELVMVGVWNTGGYRLTLVVDAMVSGLTVAFIGLACLEATRLVHGQARHLAALVATFSATYLLLAFQSFRPVTFALLLMSIAVWLLWRDRHTRSRWVWLVPTMVLVVTNVHLYVAPMGLLVASLVGLNRRGATVMGLSLLAAMCTPMLPGVIASSLSYAGGDPMVAAGKIAEMKPMSVIDATVAGLLILWCTLSWKDLGVRAIACAAVFLAMSLWLGRFQTVLALALAPLIAVRVGVLRDVVLASPVVRISTASLVGLMLMRIAISFPTDDMNMSQWANRHDVATGSIPELAAEFVERTVPVRSGRIVTEFTDGGFVGWRLPEFQVFMDGRTNVHPPEFWRDIYLSDQTALRSRLSQHAADAAILPATNSRLRTALESLGWRVVFEEPRAVVLLPPVEQAKIE